MSVHHEWERMEYCNPATWQRIYPEAKGLHRIGLVSQWPVGFSWVVLINARSTRLELMEGATLEQAQRACDDFMGRLTEIW